MLKNRWVRRTFFGLATIYVLLLIPERERSAPAGAGKTPFAWNRDSFWSQLERQFIEARAAGCEQLSDRTRARLAEAGRRLTELRDKPFPPEALEFDRLEADVFELAPLVAVCPQHLADYLTFANRARAATKRQSQQWDLQAAPGRQRLYRMLFGIRIALEQVLLQAPENFPLPDVASGDEGSSQAPSVRSHGLKLHSGDVLVSRGGAPTSALIARGNDYPGSFSHVALLHVDAQSGRAFVIESHIECGVTTSPFEDYLKDKKLRILVLRLRPDLPAVKADPMLPHKAAGAALQEAGRRHIPYDFAMDYRDPEKQFCSEVVSAAYAGQGVGLWLGPTFISSPVVSAWLGSVGVRHFETQEPADLEYDPQLEWVGEWRDRNTLLKAYADDAVTDVMLEQGKPGRGLPHQRWLLPFARLSKGYSMVLNRFGKVGSVPEGMSATQALRVKKYHRDHEAIVSRLLVLVDEFRKEKGYTPPYWELVRLARQAKHEVEK